jgi:Phosphotransferase enzyme family
VDASGPRGDRVETFRGPAAFAQAQSLRLLPDGPVATRTYSRILKARDERSGRLYAVKTCIDPRTGSLVPNAAKRQFDALRRVSQAMGNGPFAVLEPVMLREPAAELVTAWIDGDSMTQALGRHPLSFRNAERLCVLAGQWLAAFHGAHVLASGPLDIQGKLGQVDEMLQETTVRDGDFEVAVEFLRMSAMDAARALLPRSWIHGDFKLDNLLVALDRIIGIDVHASSENVVVHDLASFLNHLSLLLLGPRFLRLRLARPRLVEVFCRSYGLDRGYEAAFALQWSMLFQLLQVWTEAEIRSRPIVRRIGLRLGMQHCCRVLVHDARKTLAAFE